MDIVNKFTFNVWVLNTLNKIHYLVQSHKSIFIHVQNLQKEIGVVIVFSL